MNIELSAYDVRRGTVIQSDVIPDLATITIGDSHANRVVIEVNRCLLQQLVDRAARIGIVPEAMSADPMPRGLIERSIDAMRQELTA